MRNPENSRLLSEERALIEAEANLGRSEAALAQRLAALDHDDIDTRAGAALQRLAVIEAGGTASADMQRARAALEAMRATPALAIAARASAIQARRSALQARETASRALAGALTPVEPTKQARRRDLGTIEGYLGKLEAALERRRATQAGVAPVSGAAGPAPKARG
jgi:hypothetical protein